MAPKAQKVHYGSPFPFPPWLLLILAVALSSIAILWGLLGIESVFYQSTGEYRNPTVLQAGWGIFVSLLPLLFCIAVFCRAVWRLKKEKNQRQS
jgi:amino acid transporter